MRSQLLTMVALLAAVSGTARAQQKYEIGNPNDANYKYLNEYAGLKDYINYDKYPNFKLGVGITASEYNRKETEYRRSNANFTEVVTGNAMKCASCVRNDGSMDFTTVKNFVKTASAAGQNIYGHTLAWHAQQPVTFLNGLIKDRPAKSIKGDTIVYTELVTKDFRKQQSIGWHADYSQYGFSIQYDANDGMHVKTTRKVNSWEVQYIAMDNILTEKGGTYQMIMTVKASGSGNIHSRLGDWNGGASAEIPFTTEWKDVTITYSNTLAGSFLLLQHGDFVGDIYIKQIRFVKGIEARKVDEDRSCIVVQTGQRSKDETDNQFLLNTKRFSKGKPYTISADVRADKCAWVSVSVNSKTLDNVLFTDEWKRITVSGNLPYSGTSVAFNLSETAAANRYYFDNISFLVDGVEFVENGTLDSTSVKSFRQRTFGSANVDYCSITRHLSYLYVPSPTPLNAQEKHDTLVWAMDRWIKGMMEACDGKVRAWDVVNEALSGGGADAEGVFALQHANDNTTSDFFWQDHMGDLEYVRQAVRLARKYGPSDIKLFVNDYNLESDWDGNGKLKSLIKWIERWESDGVTYIDGIGSQMHISCYMNSGTQASKQNAVENMLRLMAQSGKLVRISELDMGMVDANGNDVKTANMTEAMHKKMAEYYEWIVKKYLEIIPPEQQWGICQWCATDSPSNSGWRADTPVGFWTLDGYRKHTYAGVVRGLGGVIYTQVPFVQTDAPAHIYDLQGRPVEGKSVWELPSGTYIIDGRVVRM